MWAYKGVDVFRADFNSSGIRWYARTANGGSWQDGTPAMLRADTKAGMRGLITHHLKGKTR